METNTKTQDITESCDEREQAPLTAIALLITDFVKVHGVASLAKRPTVGNEEAAGSPHTFG